MDGHSSLRSTLLQLVVVGNQVEVGRQLFEVGRQLAALGGQLLELVDVGVGRQLG